MVSINININEEVYKELKKLKKDDQSFSQLLRELIKSRTMLMETFGTLSNEEKLDYKKIKKSRRDRSVDI